MEILRSAMSPIEDSKPSAMCLSPQDKLMSAVGGAQRKKKTHTSTALVGGEPKKMKLDDAKDLDLDMDGWVSDDNLRSLDLDECLNQDIDWVMHDEMEMSLGLDFVQDGMAHGDYANDFGFGASSLLSPLRCEVAFGDAADMAPFVEPVGTNGPSDPKDAEKLLMSFDTMQSFTIPSPTSASSRKKRASLFGCRDNAGVSSPLSTPSSSVGGSLSPSLKIKVPAGSTASEELRKEHARINGGHSLSITAPDAFLGVLGSSAGASQTGALAERKIGSYSPEARKLRIQKFHEKRKNRTWKKSIKYDCRKKLADDRPRIKGRFVRVLENGGDGKDEVPMTPTDSSSSKALDSFPSPKSPSGAPPASPDTAQVSEEAPSPLSMLSVSPVAPSPVMTAPAPGPMMAIAPAIASAS